MKKKVCENCGSSDFKNLTATYPHKYMDKQIMVNRVAVKKCKKCSTMIPTLKGREKLARCMNAYFDMLSRI